MELKTILEPLFPSDNTVSVGWSHFSLLLSHGDCTHETLICELLRHTFGTNITRHLSLSTNDYQSDGGSSSHICIFIALQHPVKWYQGAVDPLLRQCDEKIGLKMISVVDFVRQECTQTSIGNSATSDLSGTMSDSFGGRVLEYINTQVHEFLDAVPATSSTIVVDNLTCLLDLGLTTRQLDRLLVKWNRITTGCNRLLVGCHVGQMFDDVAASESDPTFVHFIHLCRARASVLLELKPLSTGYSQTLDGKLSVTLHPTTNRTSPHVQNPSEAVRTFHYHYDGSRVMCYPPGTSKLVT